MSKLIVLAITAVLAATTARAAISPEMQDHLATVQRDGIAADSAFGRQLLHQSRRVEQGGYQETDIGFVADYSIKFIGCHHVTQWATEDEQEEAEEQDEQNGGGQTTFMGRNPLNYKIRSKGLVRYRLCPSSSCSDSAHLGCSSGHGEYVVDMASFLAAYVAWQMEENAVNCATYRSVCAKQCSSGTSSNCYQKCYKKNNVNTALCSKNSNSNYAYAADDAYAATAYGADTFDLETYIGCGAYEVTDADGAEIAHYLGPYCADQGGDLKLGFFQDATCSTPSGYDVDYVEHRTGVEIPYTRRSLVETKCMSCASTAAQDAANDQKDYYNYNANGNANYYAAKEVNDMCGTLYTTSGKCESGLSKEDQPYPEDGACTYVEGVKQLQSDGIVRAEAQRSKPAAVAIGVFTGIAVGLGGYVFYLKSVITKSQVNISGARVAFA